MFQNKNAVSRYYGTYFTKGHYNSEKKRIKCYNLLFPSICKQLPPVGTVSFCTQNIVVCRKQLQEPIEPYMNPKISLFFLCKAKQYCNFSIGTEKYGTNKIKVSSVCTLVLEVQLRN